MTIYGFALTLIMLIIHMPVGRNAPQDELLIVANTVDAALAGSLLSYLDGEGVGYTLMQLPGDESNPECEDVDLSMFGEARSNYRVILILGGHRAYGCVGSIVESLLNESEKEILERRGSVAIFIRYDVWAQGQTVVVAAGNTRNETVEAHQYYKDKLREMLKYTLLYVIPEQMPGYPQPYSIWEPPGSEFNGEQIPGGYAARVWVREGVSLIAAVTWDMDMEEKAAQLYQTLMDGHNQTFIDVGEEGFYMEENSSLGTVGFRLIGFRRGSIVVMVGGGVLCNTSTPPSRSLLEKVAAEIDGGIQHHISVYASADIAVYIANRQMQAGRPAPPPIRMPLQAVKSKTVKVDLKKDKTIVGYLKLRFDFTEIKGMMEECPENCPYMEVRIYIVEIHINKGADDGDDRFFRGCGDQMVGGVITLYFKCAGEILVIHEVKFVTGELAYVCEGETKSIEKFINTVKGCADEITVTYDLLMRDNDGGDVADILNVVATTVLSKAGKKNAAGMVNKALEALRGKGVDTTGPEPFKILRQRPGNDVGEAHSTAETQIYPQDLAP